FLAKKGLLKPPKRAARDVEPSWDSRFSWRKCTTERELPFVRALLRAGTEDLSRCYARIAKAFAGLIPSHLVTVWACSSAHDFVSHLAIEPQETTLSKNVLRNSKALIGLAVEQQAVTHVDLTDLGKYPGREFGCPELLGRGYKRM